MKRLKSIFITGGTGFLGTNIYQFLNREYPQINAYIFSRRTGGDIKNLSQIQFAIEGKNLVIHTAAQTFLAAALNGSALEKRQFIATNYNGTLNVIAACARSIWARARKGYKNSPATQKKPPHIAVGRLRPGGLEFKRRRWP